MRGVEIPKPGGGKRLLGIPIDRQTNTTEYQSTTNSDMGAEFHSWSYGFRPNRNAHQAVTQAQKFLEEGYTKVVE